MGKTSQLVPLRKVPEYRPWTTERYLRRLVHERRIPYTKLGEAQQSPVLIDLDDLDAFAAAHRVEPLDAA